MITRVALMQNLISLFVKPVRASFLTITAKATPNVKDELWLVNIDNSLERRTSKGLLGQRIRGYCLLA